MGAGPGSILSVPCPLLCSEPPRTVSGGAVLGFSLHHRGEGELGGDAGAASRPPHPFPRRGGFRHPAGGRLHQTHHHHRAGRRQGHREDPEHLQEHRDHLQAGRGVRRDHGGRQARQGEPSNPPQPAAPPKGSPGSGDRPVLAARGTGTAQSLPGLLLKPGPVRFAAGLPRERNGPRSCRESCARAGLASASLFKWVWEVSLLRGKRGTRALLEPPFPR